MLPRPPSSTLFPYTTLFRSGPAGFQKVVVIKRMLPQVRRSLEAVKLFLEEARITAAFSHPAIVQVYDLHFEDDDLEVDRKSTRLNSSHITISYAVFCLKKTK